MKIPMSGRRHPRQIDPVEPLVFAMLDAMTDTHSREERQQVAASIGSAPTLEQLQNLARFAGGELLVYLRKPLVSPRTTEPAERDRWVRSECQLRLGLGPAESVTRVLAGGQVRLAFLPQGARHTPATVMDMDHHSLASSRPVLDAVPSTFRPTVPARPHLPQPAAPKARV